MGLSQIEERLLAKEIDRIQSEISRGMKIVNAVLLDLPRSHVASDIDGERKFIEDVLEVSKTYETGSWKHKINSNLEMPDSIKRELLKRAVVDFLARIEEIGDITDELEN